ncbi:MAG TPA: VOC family protein [Nocardioides sp.]|nr:VOC family protein [Nocardioides sp.]
MSPAPVPWIQVFLDTPAAALEEAVAFWSAVTGWRPSDPRGEDGQFLTLLPPAGAAYVKLQAVDGAAGIHLDLDSADRPASIARARALGATTAWTYHDVEVMRSPGGFTFCQTLLDGAPVLVRDGTTILDQVCLDVPGDLWESEVAFWHDLTGRELQQATAPAFRRLVAPDQPRILLQRLDEPTGTVRAHPDLATADRRGDTARHVGLGARVVRVHDFWTVLEAPGGQVYCLTDRDPSTGVVSGV